MKLPSGTRMCLLVAFAFLLITTEFPEFHRARLPAARARVSRNVLIKDAGETGLGDDGDLEAVGLAEDDTGSGRVSILVNAWGWGYRRRYYGGWGYRRRWGWGGGWGYRRHCCWGK